MRRNPGAAYALPVPTLRHPHESGDDALHWLGALGKLWCVGARLDWRKLQGRSAARRVALPTYRFERKRYWIERSDPESRALKPHSSRPQDWFYLPSWQLAPDAQEEPAQAANESWLLLADDLGLAEALQDQIKPHGQVDLQPMSTSMDFGSLAERYSRSASLSIACLWPIHGPIHGPIHVHADEPFERVQQRSLYPLLQLLKAFFERCPSLQMHLYVVTDSVFRVTGEECIQASLATLRGLCKVAAQENPQISCRLIDIEASAARSDDGRSKLAAQLWREFKDVQQTPEIALRGNARWVKRYLALADSRLTQPRQRLMQQGHYLITGGLGAMGRHIAQWLAHAYQARITLVGRRPFASRQDWDQDDWSKGLQESGARVQVLQADVSDRQALENAVYEAEQAFGPLRGVFHAAGKVHDSQVPLLSTDEAVCREQFAAKVSGLINLESIVRTRPLDFCVVTSSLAAELGGLGFTAYAGANAFVDAFVQAMHNAGRKEWCAIDWDGWNFSGAVMPGMEHAMRPEDGIKAFAQAMRFCHLPCLINSTTDLDARFDRWVALSGKADLAEAVHARPELAEPYAAPTTETE